MHFAKIFVVGICRDCGMTYQEERYFWHEDEVLLGDDLCTSCEVERYLASVYRPTFQTIPLAVIEDEQDAA
jgi:hypothetical protein